MKEKTVDGFEIEVDPSMHSIFVRKDGLMIGSFTIIELIYSKG